MAASLTDPTRVIGPGTAAMPVANSIPIPGDGLLHPLALLSIGILILNDHVLKAAWPGPVTGKVSDFSGLLFVPLFLQAVWECGTAIVWRRTNPSRRVLVVSIAATGVIFAAIKLVPAATDAVASALGLAQFVVGHLLGLSSSVSAIPVAIARDPSDLIALPILALSYAIGIRRSGGSSR